MDFQDMISKMNPQMLAQGLQKISSSLSPEQLRQVEQTIKNTDKGTLNRKLNALNFQDLKKELNNNPEILKQLAQNPELVSKLQEIMKKK